MRTLIASSALAALLLGAPSIALAQQQTTGSGAYCLKGKTGAARCAYKTMAACEKARKSGQECMSRAETTGAGSGSAPKGGGMAPKRQ